MKKLKKILSLILILSTVLSALASCESSGDKQTGEGNETGDGTLVAPNKNGVILNELMASNKSTIVDNYGQYSDWIELYNDSDNDISLKNYMLTDNPEKPEKGILPDITIKAGEYLVLWASGRNEYGADSTSYHLPFSISKASETICLFDPLKQEIGRITVEDLPTDKSAAPDENGKTVILANPTPGAKNSTEIYVPQTNTDVPMNTYGSDVNTVRINEYSTSDCITFTDSDGDFGAWVELYNFGDKEISLRGLYLSDNYEKPEKWAFPEIKLGAGEYLIVFMNGKETEYSDGKDVNATFTLNGKEESLTIFNGKGDVIDTATVHELVSNLTYGRDRNDSSKWLFFPKATPNAANTVEGFAEISSARYPSNKELFVSEAVAVNATLSSSPDGKEYAIGQLYDYYELYDYIEIYNPTSESISLSDYYITDSKNYRKIGEIPDVTVKSGEYCVIYLDDETYYSSKTKTLYLGMGLNRYGETVYIFDKNGVCVDSMDTGRLFDGVSSGRASLTDDTVYFFENTTPGKKNDSKTLSASIASPTILTSGGYVSSGTQVKIQVPDGAEVYYTTDGSLPTKSSEKYTGSINITKTVTVRAVAFKDGCLPSEDVSQSYIVGRKHNMPVVCLTTDSDNLFGGKYGILVDGDKYDSSAKFPYKTKYTNYWQDWERPIHFDYIDENGTQVLSFNAGIKVFGQYSRAHDQKSVTINLRDKYGPKEICYPFFGEDNINVFSNLVLRNCGQDATKAHMRDAFAAKAVLGTSVDVDVMDYQPVVVYINGEYFGIYDLRERINANYIANHTGADPDDVDLIKSNNNVLHGSFDEYEKLETFLENNSLKNEENYLKAYEMVDVDELIDYWICVIFFSNTDSGNIKFYKSHEEGSKWRWILYDLDWGMYPSTYLDYNMFEEVMNPNGHGVGNSFSTLVLCSFMKNSGFKEKFIERCAELLNTVFAPDRLVAIYDSMIDEIREEMPYHIERWIFRDNEELWSTEEISNKLSCPYSMKSWEKNVERLRNIILDKRQQTIDHMVDYFNLSSSRQQELGLK